MILFVVVDIREVPSEMPMYLLAEDEGNEEEILRLLESDSPGGSPEDDTSNSIFSTAGDANTEQASCTVDDIAYGKSSSPASKSSHSKHSSIPTMYY